MEVGTTELKFDSKQTPFQTIHLYLQDYQYHLFDRKNITFYSLNAILCTSLNLFVFIGCSISFGYPRYHFIPVSRLICYRTLLNYDIYFVFRLRRSDSSRAVKNRYSDQCCFGRPWDLKNYLRMEPGQCQDEEEGDLK